MKQIVLHALGVNGVKPQQTQVQQGENKQQKQRKEFSGKHSKVSTAKTAPSPQSLSKCTSSNVPPGFNVISVKDMTVVISRLLSLIIKILKTHLL